jgi:CxxC motif-containing protein
MAQREIVCIGCPLGCLVKLKLGPENNVLNMSGYQCKKGKEYALAEFQHPLRVLTTTVFIEGSRRSLLPVRTDKPVPREKLKDIMRITAQLRVKPPVAIGQGIVHDILGTGANLISTGRIPETGR